MGKIKLKISDMSRQYRIRTTTDALTALKSAQHAIVGILIILFSITGCSDMPYTGSVLTVHEVDRYLVSTDGNVVCFQDDLDSACIKLRAGTGGGADDTNGPAIHIYPERRLYLFYHEGKPVVRAVRVNNKNGNNGGGSNNGSNNNNNGGGGNNGNNGGGGSNGNGGGGSNGNNGGGNNNGNNGGGGNNGNGGGGSNGGGGNNNGNNGGGGNNNNGGSNGSNGGGGNNNNGGSNGNNGGGGNNNNGGSNGSNGGGGNNNNGGNNGGGGNNNNGGNNNGNNGNGNRDNSDDTDGDNNGNNGNPPNNSDDGHGWIIWIYYPDGAIPEDPPTLSESGVTVTINGKQLTDEDITGFAQFIGPNDEAGIQFFYPTQSAELLDLKVRMEGITDGEDAVEFNINYLWNSQ